MSSEINLMQSIPAQVSINGNVTSSPLDIPIQISVNGNLHIPMDIRGNLPIISNKKYIVIASSEFNKLSKSNIDGYDEDLTFIPLSFYNHLTNDYNKFCRDIKSHAKILGKFADNKLYEDD